MKISTLDNIDPKSVTNIIFDWGGVLINIEYHATINAFRKLGLDDFKAFYSQKTQNEFFIQFEIGKISPAELRNYIRDALNKDLTDKQINDAWCAMLLDAPKSRIETLLRLKSSYNIMLLSNTNQIHEDLILPRLNKDLGIDFLSLFNRVYLSHHLGMRKPNADIYEYVINNSGFKAEETLFIDDTEMNIDAADALGIKSCYLQPNSDIVELFEDW